MIVANIATIRSSTGPTEYVATSEDPAFRNLNGRATDPFTAVSALLRAAGQPYQRSVRFDHGTEPTKAYVT